MDNYKRHAQPPEWALKTIQAGRLKGKSDINPQWRYEALTETYGLIGFGWKYEIDRLWLESGANGEITANASIFLYVKVNDVWSESIPGVGGSSFVANESKGPYTSDECYKMAITDALSVACKMLGIGANIYAGKFDGSKYNAPQNNSGQIPNSQTTTNKTWLTEEQFNAAMKSDAKGISATLKAYTGSNKAMKADYRTKLNDQLKKITNGSK